MASKEYLVVAIDVGASMCRSGRKAIAIDAIQQLLLQKMLYTKKDEVLVVLFGTADTENNVFTAIGGEDEDGPYSHIVDTTESFSTPDTTIVKGLARVPDSEHSGDLLDVLALSVSHIVSKAKSLGAKFKAGQGRIIVVTDAATPMRDAGNKAELEEGTSDIIAKMQEFDINLQVFSFDPPEEPPSHKSHKHTASASTASASCSSASSGASKLWSDLFDPATVKIREANRAVLGKVIGEVGGAHLSVLDAVGLASRLRTRTVNQVTKFRGDFTIAGDVRIPVFTYGYTTEAKLPTLKKMTAAFAEAAMSGEGEASTSSGGGVGGGGGGRDEMEDEDGGEGGEGGGGGGATGSGGVTFERRNYRGDTEDKSELDAVEMAKAYSYGKERFVIDPTEEEFLKLPTEKCLSLLCFTPIENIPRFCIIGSVDVVVPPPGNAVACTALSALACALAETNKVALVRYVKRSNGAPVLGMLVPALATSTEVRLPAGAKYTIQPSPLDIDCLYFTPLPWSEDIRNYTFPNFADAKTGAKFAPSTELLAATDKLIESMDLMHAPTADGGVREALQPGSLFNPVISRYHSALLARGLDPTAPIPPVDPRIQAYLHPDEQVVAAAAKDIASYRSIAGPGLKRGAKSESVLNPEVKLYAEVGASASSGSSATGGVKRGAEVPAASAGAGATKRSRKGDGGGGGGGGDDGHFDAAALFESGSRAHTRGACPVQRIGTVDPISDFNAMIGWKGEDLVDRAFGGMEGVVRALAKSPFDMDKAVAALGVMRAQAIVVYEDERFNKYMHSLKREHGPNADTGVNGSPFWQRVVSSGVTLISADEGPNVEDVSSEQAAAFLTSGAPVRVHVAPAPVAPPPSEAFDINEIE